MCNHSIRNSRNSHQNYFQVNIPSSIEPKYSLFFYLNCSSKMSTTIYVFKQTHSTAIFSQFFVTKN